MEELDCNAVRPAARRGAGKAGPGPPAGAAPAAASGAVDRVAAAARRAWQAGALALLLREVRACRPGAAAGGPAPAPEPGPEPPAASGTGLPRESSGTGGGAGGAGGAGRGAGEGAEEAEAEAVLGHEGVLVAGLVLARLDPRLAGGAGGRAPSWPARAAAAAARVYGRAGGVTDLVLGGTARQAARLLGALEALVVAELGRTSCLLVLGRALECRRASLAAAALRAMGAAGPGGGRGGAEALSFWPQLQGLPLATVGRVLAALPPECCDETEKLQAVVAWARVPRSLEPDVLHHALTNVDYTRVPLRDLGHAVESCPIECGRCVKFLADAYLKQMLWAGGRGGEAADCAAKFQESIDGPIGAGAE